MRLYRYLLKQFGDPGPWPWFGQEPAHTNEEIIIGAVLVQHTNWRNAALAIANLRKAGKNNLRVLRQAKLVTIRKLIRPAGFYQQKSKRLKVLAEFFSPGTVKREELLKVKGVGEETADTILLYAFNQPTFIIDAYTRRFVNHFHLTKATGYQALKSYFATRLPKNVKLYQNYHALIVQWGKTDGRL